MKIQWTFIYVGVSLILLSCTENEPPKIIDYEKALTTLYTKEFIPPSGWDNEDFKFYDDNEELGKRLYQQPAISPSPNLDHSVTRCRALMYFEEVPSYEFRTYTHPGVIQLSEADSSLEEQLKAHWIYDFKAPSTMFHQNLYITSYTYLPTHKKWVQNVPIKIGHFKDNIKTTITRDHYAQLAAHQIRTASLFEDSDTREIGSSPSAGTHVYAFGLTYKDPETGEQFPLKYHPEDACLEETQFSIYQISDLDVRVVYLVQD